MKLSYKTSWISLLLLIPSVLGTSPGLDGKHLIVAAEHWPPYFIISGDLEHPVFSGIMSQVLNYLQTSINFTSTIVRPPDATWGAFDEESGRWGGMVGMMKRNEVDFALGKFLSVFIKQLSTLSNIILFSKDHLHQHLVDGKLLISQFLLVMEV